jgi:hypothetical protein
MNNNKILEIFFKWTLKHPESNLRTNYARALLETKAAWDIHEAMRISRLFFNNLSREQKAFLRNNLTISSYEALSSEDKTLLEE